MEDTQLLINLLINFEIIETVSPQSATTEIMDTENEAEQQHKNEKKSQSDKGEQSVEQQNESMRNQKTKDAANSEEDYMRPGEKEERSEEKNQDGIDRANTGKMQMMCLSGETKPYRQITGFF